MPRHKLLTGFMLAAGSVAGTVFFRRRKARRREHVDLYFEDGSVMSLAEGSSDAARLLPLVHDALSASGGEP